MLLALAWSVHAQIVSQPLGGTSILELNDAILEKKRAHERLQEQIAQYRTKIRTTQKKAATLANQINILESNITKTELEIETRELEIEQLALETQLVEEQMRTEEERIARTFVDIGSVLREIKRYDDRKYVEIVLAERSFSEVFDQLYYTERLANNLQQKLTTLKSIRSILEENRKALQKKRDETGEKKEGLTILQNSFEQEKRTKEALFGKTKATEKEFQELLAQLRDAAAAIDSEIVTLEKTLREKLDLADKLAGETGLLSWPLSRVGGISAKFHDPDYPFRYLFEHNGLDIRTPQGTPVRAASSGYVAKVYNGGFGVRPSYVMLLHGNQLTTVYMHLSSIKAVPDTFVARGDIIGNAGGAPRTAGAGRWSTGPHLHFEVRLNGVPVDPLGYLP